MRTLAERLKWAMQCAGMDPHTDQSELARLVGDKCTPQTIQNILSGGQKTSKYTPSIAAALDCDALWLAVGTGKAPAKRKHEYRSGHAGISDSNRGVIVKLQSDDEPTITEKKPSAYGNFERTAVGYREIPVISYVQAGMMTEAVDPFSLGDGFETITTDLDLSGGAFGLIIKGPSMEPEFKEGDKVIIDPAIAPQPGDFVVAKNSHEEATFKKYRPRGTGAHGEMIFELVPLNDDFATLHSERDHLHIIGVMMEHRKYRRR